MTSIRSVRAAEGKFVQVANGAAQDRRLSLRARGVLLFILSLPPDRPFTAKWLETQVPEGREAIRSSLRELVEYGYMIRRPTSRDGTWTWEQVISDEPMIEEADDGNPSHAADDGFPSDGFPSDKELKTVTTKHESQNQAPRRAPHSVRGATDTELIVSEVRQAAIDRYGNDGAWLSDEQYLAMYRRFCCGPDGTQREIKTSIRAYLASGPFKGVPDIRSALKQKHSKSGSVPFDVQVRYDSPDTSDEERAQIVDELIGGFGPGEEPAVASMMLKGRPLAYIVAALESDNLFTAA